MREFKFKEKKVGFLFNGETFYIDITKAGSVMAEVGRLLKEAAEDNEKSATNTLKVVKHLDKLIGEGNVSRIFEMRGGVNIEDVCDFVSFISSEIIEYTQNTKGCGALTGDHTGSPLRGVVH